MSSTAVAPHSNGSNGSVVAAPPEPTSRRERVSVPVELPRAARPGPATLAALAVVAGIAAIALGVLALVSGLDRGSEEAALPTEAEAALALLARPSTERIPLARTGESVTLAVGEGARAVLLLDGLAASPEGKAYQAWVVEPGSRQPLPAAVFSGGERVVPLSRPVPPGATVGVTVENAVGVDAPTRPLRLVARRP